MAGVSPENGTFPARTKQPMGGRKSKSDTVSPDSPTSPWPSWACQLASLALLLHIVAILAAALASPPSSPLEMRLAGIFAPYYNLIDQGYAYRYYAPEP